MSCNIEKYGEERRCTKCGYILWEEEGKTNEDILKEMVAAGYPSPECKE